MITHQTEESVIDEKSVAEMADISDHIGTEVRKEQITNIVTNA